MYEPEKGMNFYQAVKTLQGILEEQGSRDRQMNFNGIYLYVSADSNPDDLATIYDLKNEIRRLTGRA